MRRLFNRIKRWRRKARLTRNLLENKFSMRRVFVPYFRV